MDELFEALLQARGNPTLDEVRAIPRADKGDPGSLLVGAMAGAVGWPVDIVSETMRPLGYDVPPEQVIGSTDWWGAQSGHDMSQGPGLLGQFLTPDAFDLFRVANTAFKGARDLDGILNQMTVYHGSPHQWDEVDLSKVGTGEGAQAYGHGFYAAQAKEVAQEYQKMGMDPTRISEDILRALDGKVQAPIGVSIDAGNQLKQPGVGVDDVVRYLRERADELSDPSEEIYAAGYRNMAEAIQSEAAKVGGININTGHLYELDLPDETIDKMLDWDAPLSEQPDNVRRAIRDLQEQYRSAEGGMNLPYLEDHMTGEQMYREFDQISHWAGDSDTWKSASERLNALGIPGIKYLDGTSRSAGQGTRNFVIFDEAAITPLTRNGNPIK